MGWCEHMGKSMMWWWYVTAPTFRCDRMADVVLNASEISGGGMLVNYFEWDYTMPLMFPHVMVRDHACNLLIVHRVVEIIVYITLASVMLVLLLISIGMVFDGRSMRLLSCEGWRASGAGLIAHDRGCELTIIWLIELTTGTLLLSCCSDDLKRWFVCNWSNQFTSIYLLQRDTQHLARSLADGGS